MQNQYQRKKAVKNQQNSGKALTKTSPRSSASHHGPGRRSSLHLRHRPDKTTYTHPRAFVPALTLTYIFLSQPLSAFITLFFTVHADYFLTYVRYRYAYYLSLIHI